MPSKATRRKIREAAKRNEPAETRPARTSPDTSGKRGSSLTAGAADVPRDKTYPRAPVSPLRRLYAFMLDVTVLLVLIMTFGQVLKGALFSRNAAPQDIFILLAYFIIPTGLWGRTLGKWVAGIVVVDESGRTPGVAVAIAREVAWKVLSVGLAGTGLLLAFRDKERRALHDRLAGTWVVEASDGQSPIFNRLFGVRPRKEP